jgi:ArsR family transcriptional regulator
MTLSDDRVLIHADWDGTLMTPLYEIKAELFKTLGHPARVRALELLSAGEMSVGDLQRELGLESSHLSQQLAVLRRAELVTTRRQGSSVFYTLTAPDVAELFAVARRLLTARLARQTDQLRELADDAESAPPAATQPGQGH